MTPESGDVKGRLMVTSATTAMARNYSCGTYKSLCNLQLSTYFSDIDVTENSQMYGAGAEICVNSQPLQCANTSASNGTVNYNWNVGSSSVIELNSSSQQLAAKPMLTGVGTGSGTATVTASAGACQASTTQHPTVQPPPVMTVHFTGAKTAGDNLSLEAGDSCSESLGLMKCSSGFGWNLEFQGIVPDNATYWNVSQNITSARAAGYEKNNVGTLIYFDTGTFYPGADGPEGQFIQNTSGTTNVFFVDSPGHSLTDSDNNDTYDSFTQVQNFTVFLCSRMTAFCYPYNYYVKIVVCLQALSSTPSTRLQALVCYQQQAFDGEGSYNNESAAYIRNCLCIHSVCCGC